MNTTGQVYIALSDAREVATMKNLLALHRPEWVIKPISSDEFSMETRALSPLPLEYDDEVLVTVYSGPASGLEPDHVIHRVKPIMDCMGLVRDMVGLRFGTPSDDGLRVTTYELRVRYFDCRDAMNAAKTLNGIRTDV